MERLDEGYPTIVPTIDFDDEIISGVSYVRACVCVCVCKSNSKDFGNKLKVGLKWEKAHDSEWF